MVYRAFFLLGMILPAMAFAQEGHQVKQAVFNPRPFDDNAHHWYAIQDKHAVIHPRAGHPQYKPGDIAAIGDNILLYQKNNGGWAKNYDIMAILTPEQRDSLIADKGTLNTTFDNGSTYTQVTALAGIYQATQDERYKQAALKGLDFILAAQYGNGGWPQYYPIEKGNYSRYITYNDGAFLGIMQLMKDIKTGKSQYDFIDAERRQKLLAAYNKALPCMLKTQINDAGKPTAWCQQYDERTLQPAWARKFEPASICNHESADVVLFLMSIDHPSKEVMDAVQYAVKWFEDSRIYHTRINTVAAKEMVTPYRISETDKVVVEDKNAPPIWTRYYELKTHRPIFCNRDSKIVYSLAEVERERRDGYAWYTYAPQKVLDKYPAWQQKWEIEK